MINFSFLSTKKKIGQGGKKTVVNRSQEDKVADQVRKVLGSNDQGLIVMVRN